MTSQNFYTLYDIAFLGIVSHSKVPLRLATMIGFATAILSLLVALGYLIYKLMFWHRVHGRGGAARDRVLLPVLGAALLRRHRGRVHRSIYTQVRNHPHVFEKERINFERACCQLPRPGSLTRRERKLTHDDDLVPG